MNGKWKERCLLGMCYIVCVVASYRLDVEGFLFCALAALLAFTSATLAGIERSI